MAAFNIAKRYRPHSSFLKCSRNIIVVWGWPDNSLLPPWCPDNSGEMNWQLMHSAALESQIIVSRTITITSVLLHHLSLNCLVIPKTACLMYSAKKFSGLQGKGRSASRWREVCREWASISPFFLLFLCVKRMCSLASGTTTRTVVGLRHGKHSSEKTPIAMWSRTKPPTEGWKIPLPLHSWWIWSTHKPWEKSPSLSSETPSGIQDVSPPEIFQDEIRATAEPLPSYSPSRVHDLWTSLWADFKGVRVWFKRKQTLLRHKTRHSWTPFFGC